MVSELYSKKEEKESEKIITPNSVTIAVSAYGNNLCKIISPGAQKSYDQAVTFKWFISQVENLHDMVGLLRWLSHCRHSCLIRGVPKNHRVPSRRIFRDDNRNGESTIVEIPQNWFAIDIDKFEGASGDLVTDAKQVLLALDLEDTECVVIPTANYRIKPQIRLRLFFWNNERIGYRALKMYFKRYKDIVDLSQFHPIQPIYTARPIFIDMNDPCSKLLAHIPGNQYTYISEFKDHRDMLIENEYTVDIAEKSLNKVCIHLEYVPDGERHDELFKAAVWIGKLVAQELLDYETAMFQLEATANHSWGGDIRKNKQTIIDGFKYGEQAMGRKQS